MGPHATAFIFYGVCWSIEKFHVDIFELEDVIEKQLEALGLVIEESGNRNYEIYNILHVNQTVNLSVEDHHRPRQFDPNRIYVLPQEQYENTLKSINQALELLKVPQDIQEKLALGWHLAANLGS